MACQLNKLLLYGRQGALSSKHFSVLKSSPGISDAAADVSGRNEVHMTAVQSYPTAAALKLPDNYQDVNASELGRFSPLRSRDISGSVISSSTHGEISERFPKFDITVDSDPHIGSYDCRGAVSLSSSMQSNVPSPFGGQGSILGMPGSQWGQGHKYLSDYQHNSHYLNLRNSYSRAMHSSSLRSGTKCQYHTSTRSYINNIRLTNLSCPSGFMQTSLDRCNSRNMSDVSKARTEEIETPKKGDKPSAEESTPLTKVQQLKVAIATYGSTVIVFHVAISLASLGGCYLLVSSGLDVMGFMDYIGLADSAITKKVTANAGTFVVAYAVHKIFAPLRIGITLTATPFIVRYLRRVGILKTPVKKT